MDRLAIETMDERDAPAGLSMTAAALGGTTLIKDSARASLVLTFKQPAPASVQPGFNHLVSETPPPQAAIEGTDVGGDGGGGPIDYSYAVCEDEHVDHVGEDGNSCEPPEEE